MIEPHTVLWSRLDENILNKSKKRKKEKFHSFYLIHTSSIKNLFLSHRKKK